MKDFISLFITFFHFVYRFQKMILVEYVQSFHEDDEKRLKVWTKRKLYEKTQNLLTTRVGQDCDMKNDGV